MHGTFDYNRTPIAPPGIFVICHKKPDQRGSWEPHGKEGWYIGPAMNSYCCWTVWITETRAEQIVNAISWFPKSFSMPVASTNDIIMAALQDIANALTNPKPPTPAPELSTAQRKVLQDVTEILTSVYTSPDDNLEPMHVDQTVSISTCLLYTSDAADD